MEKRIALVLVALAAGCGSRAATAEPARTSGSETASREHVVTAERSDDGDDDHTVSADELASGIAQPVSAAPPQADVGVTIDAEPLPEPTCPADLDGLTVRVAAIPGGGALVFTAAETQIDPLRARLERIASAHPSSRGGTQIDGSTALARANEVRVVETDVGARLEIRFEDESDVSALRSELREHAADLRAGRCPLALDVES